MTLGRITVGRQWQAGWQGRPKGKLVPDSLGGRRRL